MELVGHKGTINAVKSAGELSELWVHPQLGCEALGLDKDTVL